jgi:hypothetical protein
VPPRGARLFFLHHRHSSAGSCHVGAVTTSSNFLTCLSCSDDNTIALNSGSRIKHVYEFAVYSVYQSTDRSVPPPSCRNLCPVRLWYDNMSGNLYRLPSRILTSTNHADTITDKSICITDHKSSAECRSYMPRVCSRDARWEM